MGLGNCSGNDASNLCPLRLLDFKKLSYYNITYNDLWLSKKFSIKNSWSLKFKLNYHSEKPLNFNPVINSMYRKEFDIGYSIVIIMYGL